ncbi:hypothetical protein SATMO3_37020 [Sporomusa aerivorans]
MNVPVVEKALTADFRIRLKYYIGFQQDKIVNI